MPVRRAFLSSALAILVGSAAVAVPGLANGPVSAEERAGAQASALVRWQARWQTNFGVVTLRQRGRTVTGTYSHGNATINGRAKGTTGRGLVANWKQRGLRGTLVFRMSANRCRFNGTYDVANSSGGGDWNGVRKVDRCRGQTP
jgi:hypothetical protein